MMMPIVVLQHAIQDCCKNFESVRTLEEAEMMITLEEFHDKILQLVDLKNKKKLITSEFLKSELLKNNLFTVCIEADEGPAEVWLLKNKV